MADRVAVIGGGAAGFFSAIQCKIHHPQAQVVIFEKSAKFLAKVKISGGGRCNVTNAESDVDQLVKAYPRGARLLKKAFREFSTPDTCNFFQERGVPLVVQEDNCVFPHSQNSQSIINCFLNECAELAIELKLQQKLTLFECADNGGFNLVFNEELYHFHKVIVCTGGSPNLSGFSFLHKFNLTIVPLVPSLFTFNMPSEKIVSLMGSVVNPVLTKIKGTNYQAIGPLLITHWGMSGPAILVLSAHAARALNDKNYQCELLVNWTGEKNEELIREQLLEYQLNAAGSKLKKFGVFGISQRLWQFLLQKWGVSPELKWGELGKKTFNTIINGLSNDTYQVSGKTTYKEEFVTAGGIDLATINFKNLESKAIPGLHFAGEILDIDGVTGGFNFQAAWTTAFLAGKYCI